MRLQPCEASLACVVILTPHSLQEGSHRHLPPLGAPSPPLNLLRILARSG